MFFRGDKKKEPAGNSKITSDSLRKIQDTQIRTGIPTLKIQSMSSSMPPSSFIPPLVEKA